MATKKAAPPQKTTALANWSEELAKHAREASANEASAGVAGNYVSIQGGVLKYKGAVIPGGVMNVVVLANQFLNAWNAEAFDPRNPRSPDCYAKGPNFELLIPHAEAEKPQNKDCATCEYNQWGSDRRGGKGKDCANKRILAIMSQGDLEDLDAAEIAELQIPPTQGPKWGNYVQMLNDTFKLPPFAVVTEITVKPDAKTQVSVDFRLVEQIENAALFERLIALHQRALKQISLPFSKNAEREAPAPVRRAAPAKFAKAVPAARR